MASVDPPERNRAFAESLGADFPILSDPSGEVARAYGVVDSGRSVARRWTFYIDPDGVVRRVDREVGLPAGPDGARPVAAPMGHPRHAGGVPSGKASFARRWAGRTCSGVGAEARGLGPEL
jgi:hypothetical protein